MARVDPVLAADRAVHLRHQGGRDLDEVDAAHEQGGGEARDVADDPAAEGDEHGGPIDAQIQEPVKQRVDLPERLRAFAVRNGHRIPADAETAESRSETGQVRIADHRIGHHHHPAAAGDDGLQPLFRGLQQPFADHDVVAAIPQVHAHDPVLVQHFGLLVCLRSELAAGPAVKPADGHSILADGAASTHSSFGIQNTLNQAMDSRYPLSRAQASRE